MISRSATLPTLSRRTILAGSLLAATPRGVLGQERPKIWRQYAKCRYGQIHLTIAAPAGTPSKAPLVCLHQSPVSGGYYREFQGLLATDRLVICPDTPGYGSSDGPSTQPDMAALGGAMAEALSDLGYGTDGKGAVDWLGFHTGNYVITEVVAQRGDLVRRLVMPGIPYYPADQREALRKQFAVPRPYFTDSEFVGKNYKDTVLNATDGLSKERRLELFVSRLQAGPESWWGFDAVFRYDADPALARIAQPVLCPILTKETLAEPTRQAAKLMKNSTVIELEGLSGSAWQLSPDVLASVIRPFLDKA